MSLVQAHTIHHTFYKRNKKPVPQALLSYIWEFLRTLEKCKKHSPLAHFLFL